MEATHWITALTHSLQHGTASLAQPTSRLADSIVPWVNEYAIAALAAAVVTLGCVMLMELRALAALRRNVDSHLTRVFEQLDLIRYDHVQLLEAYARHAAGSATLVPASARAETTIISAPMPTSAAVPTVLAPAAIA